MTSTPMGAANLSASDTVQSIFITALQNTMALEKEATQLIQRQLERLERYPEMTDILRVHQGETERQIERLNEILHAHGADRSRLKDAFTTVMGNLAALAHAPMADEILKNTFANHAFENFEIASYKSMIAITEAAGHGQHLTALRQSLGEEEKTARLIYDQVEPITRKYLTLSAKGEKADH